MNITISAKLAQNVTILLLAVSFLLPSTMARAEQANAEVYRQILTSGKFYIEYEIETQYSNPEAQKQFDGRKMDRVTALAVDGDKKAYWAKGLRSGNTILGSQSMKNKLFKDALKESWKMDRNKMYLNYLCRDGKCYYFFGKNNALVVPEKELGEMPTSQSGMWKSVAKNELSLPHALEVFAPDFNAPKQSGEIRFIKPNYSFVESGNATFQGENLAFDKYEAKYSSNSESAKYVSTMREYIYCYYDANGNLKYVKTEKIETDNELNKEMEAEREAMRKEMEARLKSLPSRVRKNDLGTVEHYYRIDKISGEIPAGAFDFPSGLKVYAAESGNIAELTDNYALVEQY